MPRGYDSGVVRQRCIDQCASDAAEVFRSLWNRDAGDSNLVFAKHLDNILVNRTPDGAYCLSFGGDTALFGFENAMQCRREHVGIDQCVH